MGEGTAHIGVHHVAQIAGLTFNMDTLFMTWVSMAAVIALVILATRKLEMIPRRNSQNLLELAVEALLGQIQASAGAKGRQVASLVITLFLYLLIANWLGLVPGFSSPTNDINTTLGLALMVIVTVQLVAIRNWGILKYLRHFFQPSILFFPINVIEECSKPITLACRLFGNIFAGEVLLIILTLLVPYLIPSIWLGFSVFVGFIQALIFTIMTLSYLSNSLKDSH